MTRTEYLEWAKQRAYAYLERGRVMEAYKSFSSDLAKNAETHDVELIKLMTLEVLAGNLGTVEAMRKFIEGFN